MPRLLAQVPLHFRMADAIWPIAHRLIKQSLLPLSLMLAAAAPATGQTLPLQLPSAAEPGREVPEPAMPTKAPGVPRVAVPEGQATQAPAGAEQLNFTLRVLDIEGVTHYSPDQLLPLYEKLLGTRITVAE